MNEKKKYTVEVSPDAARQLALHIRFISNVDKNAAGKTKNEIMNSIRSLNEFPERFPYFEEDYIPKYKYRKLTITHGYIILFQVKDMKVYVEYILDTRKEYPWIR